MSDRFNSIEQAVTVWWVSTYKIGERKSNMLASNGRIDQETFIEIDQVTFYGN